jgi:excisionase family DNA binding protein
MSKLLTIKNICEIAGVTRGTVIAWIREGKLPAFKLGGGRLWRIRERDFQKFIKKNLIN